MKKYLFVLIGLIAMIAGCVNPVTGLQKSSDYSADALINQGVMVGAVATGISNEKDDAVQNYDAVLARLLAGKLKTEIQSNRCIGDKSIQAIKEQLKSHAELSDAIKNELNLKQCAARYIVFARIERDEILQHRDVRQDYLFIHREPGMLMPNDDAVIEIDFIRDRKLTSAFWILDKQTGKTVWTAAITESEPNINRNSRIFSSMNMLNEIWADEYIRSMPENNTAFYPPPATREAVWETLVTTFVKQLKQ